MLVLVSLLRFLLSFFLYLPLSLSTFPLGRHLTYRSHRTYKTLVYRWTCDLPVVSHGDSQSSYHHSHGHLPSDHLITEG